MTEKIYNGLKQKYSSFGLSDDFLRGKAESLSAFTTDDNLEAVISGQEKELKNYQSSLDKMRGELATKTKLIEELGKDKEVKPFEPTQVINKSPNPENALAAIMAKLDEKLDEKLSSVLSEVSEVKTQRMVDKRQEEFLKTLNGIDNHLVDLFKDSFESKKALPQEEYDAYFSKHSEMVKGITASNGAFSPQRGNLDTSLSKPSKKDIEQAVERIKNNTL